jgi:uncharacterized protein YceK
MKHVLIKAVVVISVMFLLNGCTLARYGVFHKNPPSLYPATKLDLTIIRTIEKSGRDTEMKLLCYLDMPFSVFFDTILLPFDFLGIGFDNESQFMKKLEEE